MDMIYEIRRRHHIQKQTISQIQWLEVEMKLLRPRWRSAQRMYENLQEIGYQGAYDSVQRFIKQWRANHQGPRITAAFVPMIFAAGEACQFDWRYEFIELAAVLQTVKVAHFRLAYSREMFVVAY